GFSVWSNGVKRWSRCRFAGGLIGLFDLLYLLVFGLGALRRSGFARLFQWMLFRRLQDCSCASGRRRGDLHLGWLNPGWRNGFPFNSVFSFNVGLLSGGWMVG